MESFNKKDSKTPRKGRIYLYMSKTLLTFEELQTFCKNILRHSLNTTEKECSEFKDKEP